MKLIFFQNCISPHQIPYIRECVNNQRIENVYLIVPRTDYSMRRNMGWDSSGLLRETGINYLLKPLDEQVKALLKKENVVCLFSGIRADVDVFHWLNLSFNYNVKRYIITEPPYTYNKPLWMHYIRFFIQDYRYIQKRKK